MPGDGGAERPGVGAGSPSAERSATASFASVTGREEDLVAQQARLAYVNALAQRYQDTAQLFVAMGGRWWTQGDFGAAPPPMG